MEWGSATNKAWEGLLAQGNGYLHVRGSFEEGLASDLQNVRYERRQESVTVETQAHPVSRQGVYVPIILGYHPVLRQVVLNLPWFLGVRVAADGEVFDMGTSSVSKFERQLDWRVGLLSRKVTWETMSGCVIDLVWERFASKANRHLFVQRVRAEIRSGSPVLAWETGIDADVVTNGHYHFTAEELDADGTLLSCNVATDLGDRVALVSRVVFDTPTTACPSAGVTGKSATLTWSDEAGPGQVFGFTKVTAVATSRDAQFDLGAGGSCVDRAVRELGRACEAGWSRLLAKSGERWMEAWAADRADGAVAVDVPHLRWATYHMLRCTPAFPGATQICPKGFAGEAYYGRYFWDTEIYLLPFYIATDPAAARGLLEYRYRTLDGARANAAVYHCGGAKYAWQSGLDGTEQCALWEYADLELHITADIAYAIVRYVESTADLDFMWTCGLEILIETARYWVDRADWDNLGAAHLINIMGPDEYSPMTRDNAFTNRMVRFNLEQAVAWAYRLMAADETAWAMLEAKLEVGLDELGEFERLAGALPIPYDERLELTLQAADFEEYAEIDIDGLWRDRTRAFGWHVTQEKLYRSRCLKQADVILLMSLFPDEFTDRQVRAAYTYYKPYCVHDSSLSPAAHVMVARRLGLDEDVRSLVADMLAVDFDPDRGGAAEGMHIANCACIWQLADSEVRP
ncbi:MAG: hypothetical protein LBC97_12195 [Bifidobacteriaceae bacterium]|nr:hypothetical protein [Bifidobacteriaceae bacterium]